MMYNNISSRCLPPCRVTCSQPWAYSNSLGPCVASCGDSRAVVYAPPVVVNFPGPILSSCPQESIVGTSFPQSDGIMTPYGSGMGGSFGSGGSYGSGDMSGMGGSYGSGGMSGMGGSYGSGGMSGMGGSYGYGGMSGMGGSYGSGGSFGYGSMSGMGGSYGSGGSCGYGGSSGMGGSYSRRSYSSSSRASRLGNCGSF